MPWLFTTKLYYRIIIVHSFLYTHLFLISHLSSLVNPSLELKPNAGSDRSWTWRTVDYATDEAENQTFALRFKDAESKRERKESDEI